MPPNTSRLEMKVDQVLEVVTLLKERFEVHVALDGERVVKVNKLDEQINGKEGMAQGFMLAKDQIGRWQRTSAIATTAAITSVVAAVVAIVTR